MTYERCNFILSIYISALAIFVSGCATANRREMIASLATVAERACDAAGNLVCSQMAVAVGTPLAMIAKSQNADENPMQTQSQTNEAQVQTAPQANGGIPVITVVDDGKPHVVSVYDGLTEVVFVKKKLGKHPPNVTTQRIAAPMQPYTSQPRGGFVERALFHITNVLIPQSY